jgi:hypothetical protein
MAHAGESMSVEFQPFSFVTALVVGVAALSKGVTA